MTIQELLSVLQHLLLIRIGSKKPELQVDGKLYDVQQVLKATKNLEQWCYKELRVDDIEKVCRCKNCARYKRYRKRGQPRSRGKMLCSIDKVPRSPEYYCASAIERRSKQ